MIASGRAGQAKLPAVPDVNDGTFDTNLRSALKATQVDSVAPPYGTASMTTAGPNTAGLAKSGPQRTRRADALGDWSASGQVGVSLPLVPVQDGALPWQIPTGADLKLQVPAVSNDAPAGVASALQQVVGEADFLQTEMVVTPSQWPGQDTTPPGTSSAPGTPPLPEATSGAEGDSQEPVLAHKLETARAGFLTDSLVSPALASIRGQQQAAGRGAAQVQMAASQQPLKHRNLPEGAATLANDSFPAAGISDLAPPTVALPQSPEALTSLAGVTDLPNFATGAEGATHRNQFRLIQTASEGESSSPASAQTQVQDTSPSSFSLLVGSDQGDVNMAKSAVSPSPTGSEASGEKTEGQPSMKALLTVSGSFETTDRSQGQPQAPVPGGVAHQASTTGPNQAGEVQTQGGVGVNLQRVLQHSEVQVHIDAAEYGRVSVHASYGRDGLAARIRLEDTALGSALGSALSAGAPNLEQRLRGDLGTRALVSVSTEPGSARTDAGGGQGESRSREQARVPPPTTRNPSPTYALTTTSVPTVVRGIISGTRLDVHI